MNLISEDTEAWQQAVEGTHPLPASCQSKIPVLARKPATQHSSGSTSVPMHQLRYSTLKLPLATLDDNTRRQIRIGRMPIEYTLDLHGMTQAAGYSAFFHCVQMAYNEGLRLILVITGKGRLSESGILRNALPEWCTEPALRPMIIAVNRASVAHGGDGAYYVRIRKHE